MQSITNTIEGFVPALTHRPRTVAELGDLVRRAAAEGAGLYPVGGGTMQHLGRLPAKPGWAIDMRGLDAVIDYPARDMTITVQAGITIAKLQSLLAVENQRLPIDVPQPETATLGGSIAVNACGSRRYGFGTLRDYVIGISFTDDQGHEAKAGGRVVKNVAGYDLCKLHVGALGTLGIITQVTLKLKPLPEDRAVVTATVSMDQLGAALDRIHASQTRPTCIDVISASDDMCSVVVGFEENRDAVRWQVEQIQRECSGLLALQVHADSAAIAAWHTLLAPANPAARLGFKANLLPSALPEYLRRLKARSEFAWRAHAGNGIVFAHADGDWSLPQADAMLRDLRIQAVAADGNLVITRCPPAWKRELPLWGEPRGDWKLMTEIKRRLDPKNLFNPDRFV